MRQVCTTTPLTPLHRVRVRGHPDACQERQAVVVAGDGLDVPQLVVERRAPEEPEVVVHDDSRVPVPRRPGRHAAKPPRGPVLRHPHVIGRPWRELARPGAEKTGEGGGRRGTKMRDI